MAERKAEDQNRFVGSTTPFSTHHVDYVQRNEFNIGALSTQLPQISAAVEFRRLLHVKGVGRTDKGINQPFASASTPAKEHSITGQDGGYRGTQDIMVGLSSLRIPLAFLVVCKSSHVSIRIGTWTPVRHGMITSPSLDMGQGVLEAVCRGFYPEIRLVKLSADEMQFTRPPMAGLALGIPTLNPPNPADGSLQIDRLIRGMHGTNWAYLILAEPVDEQYLGTLRDSTLNELRAIQSAIIASGDNPLASYYSQLLNVCFNSLSQSQSVGAWRTAVYLLGDVISYPRLASMWRSVYSGDMSQPESVRVWQSDAAPNMAINWAMADVPGRPGPGDYRRPFEFQTLLTSSQLAAYVQLPNHETDGFSVDLIPEFDVVPGQQQQQDCITIGKVIERTELTNIDYTIDTKSLTRHAFVAGVTGSGKTNTIFHLLRQVNALGIPFLVIEPAKTEYRALMGDPHLGSKLRVFTLGNELNSPLRLNPFEVPEGIPVGVHLDLLRSVFTVSFGMWTPLPQILEQCLYQIYEDRGWDITNDINRRIDSVTDRSMSFPTLSDLSTKIDQVIQRLGYEQKVADDMRTALHVRINGLRTGGKGRMLDVQRSIPIKTLLEQPTVLELEGMGDDDDKAFLMGLLFMRLVEQRRASGSMAGLQHLLVIEEAHRLLANAGRSSSVEEADPSGKSIQTFTSLLSEIRAYGEGVIIADQVPVKLSPDVIKNTNLKIVHRIVAQDDRVALASAMAMTDRQAITLATLRQGQAAVFAELDDAPILVMVPAAKGTESPNNEQISKHMSVFRQSSEYASLFLSYPECVNACKTSIAAQSCIAARNIVEDASFESTFGRFVLTLVEDDTALNRIWIDLIAVIQAKRPPQMDENTLLRCVFVQAARRLIATRGAQARWTYRATKELTECLIKVLIQKAMNGATADAVHEFQACARKDFARIFDPYPMCKEICYQQPALCLYRYPIEDMITGSRIRNAWIDAETKISNSEPNGRSETWLVCQDAMEALVEWPEGLPLPENDLKVKRDVAKRVGLCFAQQMLNNDNLMPKRSVRSIIEKLLKEANYGPRRDR